LLLKYTFFIFNIVYFSNLYSVDLPSDEAYEKEHPLPIRNERDKPPRLYYDFYEPLDLFRRKEMETYAAEIEREKIYQDQHWKNLLRYNKRIFGGNYSEVVSESYFLSEKGYQDPRKEILATLRGLYFRKEESSDLDPECLFPERYRWLRQRLKIKESYQKEDCQRFQKWKEGINLDQVKIVFASYYLQSPASMFGHTFLKLNHRDHGTSELLDYGLGYAANPGEVDPLRYVVGGLFGGYTGKFSLVPYYIKVNEYNDLENRDLWEYELKLSDQEKEILLGHIWEMGEAEFDYYFQKENCAYQILKILEVVKNIDFKVNTSFTITPLDLLKEVKKFDLFTEDSPQYRPSLYQKISNQLVTLETQEQHIYWKMLSEINQNKKIPLDRITNDRLGSLLIDTYQYRYQNQVSNQEGYLDLLLLQSNLPTSNAVSKLENSIFPPDFAHGSRRFALGFGNSSLGNYSELEARAAYHDILNVSKGLPTASEIQFFNFKVRSYEDRKAELTSLNLVKLTSLSPYNHLSQKHSYLIDFGSQTLSINNVENRKAVGNLDLMYGYSFSREFLSGFNWGILSLLAGVKTQTNREFHSGMRYGPETMIHYLYEWHNWKLQWFYIYSYLRISSNDNYYQNTVRLRYAIMNDNEIRIEYSAYPLYSETLLSYHYLF